MLVQALIDEWGHYIQGTPADEETEYELHSYLRTTDTSEPLRGDTTKSAEPWQSYLVSGEPIQLVVESIATSLRRVLVLSPAYLKSEYCIWELCSCLIYSQSNPLVVLVSIGGFSDFKAAEKLEYCFGCSSLVEALCQVYKAHKKEMHKCFHLDVGISSTMSLLNCVSKNGLVTRLLPKELNWCRGQIVMFGRNLKVRAKAVLFARLLEQLFWCWLLKTAGTKSFGEFWRGNLIWLVQRWFICLWAQALQNRPCQGENQQQ
jgi:hypothetical protein